MPIAAAIPAIIGVAGGIGGAALSGHAAGQAADTQAQAAEYSANLQAEAQQNALNFQKQTWAQTQNNAAPFLAAGQGAIGQLSALTSQPGQGLLQNYQGQFTAPTAAEAEQTPGYQFAFQQGLQALDRGAAARGNLLTGGTGEAEQQYGQGLASQTYQQTFNNALTQYQQAYNQFQQGQANTYNRLAGVAGTGQVAAQTLGNQGQQAVGQVANINQYGAAAQGQQLNNAAAATASGYVGQANAYSGLLGQLGNYAQLGQTLYNSQKQQNQANNWGNLNVGSGGLPTVGTDIGGGWGRTTWP